MLQGRIIGIQEIPTFSGKQSTPPQIVIQVLINKMPGDGGEIDVYVIEDSPVTEDPKKKIELVQ